MCAFICYHEAMTNSDIDRSALIIWNYMQMNEKPVKSDAVFCLCSHDTRVAERAAELMNYGYGDILIISGGFGKLTEDIFDEPEAEIFSKIAIARGVAPERILLEPRSTNTGENITFTYDLLQSKKIHIESFVLVQKPYMERRSYATFKKQWPDNTTKITVTSPRLSFDEYTAAGISRTDVIHVMVGDLQRIREYPALGYQIEQSIPEDVWNAYLLLVSAGFDHHLIGR